MALKCLISDMDIQTAWSVSTGRRPYRGGAHR